MNNSIIELTKEEALKCLENGHAIYPEEKTDAIAKALGFEYNKKLFVIMKNEPPYMYIPGELEGKKGYSELGYDACAYWKLNYIQQSGRGSQARQHVVAIRKHLRL